MKFSIFQRNNLWKQLHL